MVAKQGVRMQEQYEGKLSTEPAFGPQSGGELRELLCQEMVGWHGSMLHGWCVLMLAGAVEGQD